MNSQVRPRRPLVSFLMVMAVASCAGAVIGGAAGYIGNGSLPLTTHILAAAVACAAAAVVMWACLRWWRNLDEAAQEAHKWAWWWGGSAGMLAGVLAFVLLETFGGRAGVTLLDGTAPVGEAMSQGAAAILMFQVVGYVIAWAAWWLRHR